MLVADSWGPFKGKDIVPTFIIEVQAIEARHNYVILADGVIVRSCAVCSGCEEDLSAGTSDMEAVLDGDIVWRANFADVVTVVITPLEHKHRV